MSIWVYDVVSKSHKPVEHASVQAFMDYLNGLYEHVMDDVRECEVYGVNQRNLLVFTTPECYAHMSISVYEKPDSTLKVGQLTTLDIANIEKVHEIAGGLADDGNYWLVLNKHNYLLPFSTMLELAMVNLQSALNKEIRECAK